jgi:hypothetical protein
MTDKIFGGLGQPVTIVSNEVTPCWTRRSCPSPPPCGRPAQQPCSPRPDARDHPIHLRPGARRTACGLVRSVEAQRVATGRSDRERGPHLTAKTRPPARWPAIRSPMNDDHLADSATAADDWSRSGDSAKLEERGPGQDGGTPRARDRNDACELYQHTPGIAEARRASVRAVPLPAPRGADPAPARDVTGAGISSLL